MTVVSPPESPTGLAPLFKAYQERADMTARDELIRRFLPLAHRLARRYAHPGGEPVDDLVQVATLGLIKAIDRFDTARGFAFASFATPTILGELRRYFRDSTWSIHLPRQIQEDVLRVEQATQELGGRLGRSPTVEELSEHTKLEPEAVLEALTASRETKTRSLDAPVGTEEEEDASLGDQQGRIDIGYEAVEYGASAGIAVAALSPRDREILRLRFVEDRTQSEIAEAVGLSQRQVSRVLAKSVAAMREAAGAGEVA